MRPLRFHPRRGGGKKLLEATGSREADGGTVGDAHRRDRRAGWMLQDDLVAEPLGDRLAVAPCRVEHPVGCLPP
jgi:hypothetical protein